MLLLYYILCVSVTHSENFCNFGQNFYMQEFFPNYFSSRAIKLYLLLLMVVSIFFINRILPLIWIVTGVTAVLFFFFYAQKITKRWYQYSDHYFLRRLFITSFIIRLVWVAFSYFFYQIMVGEPFDFAAADAKGYHNEAVWVADLLSKGDIADYFKYMEGRYSDMGYPLYLGFLYWLTDDSIIIARILKALYSSLTVIFTYKVAQRNFGDDVGRMAGIFLMLFPNVIFYTGLHLKEVEMIFLTMFFIERSDLLFRNKRINLGGILLMLTIITLLFFFRTVLGAAALFAALTALVLSEKKVSKITNRWFMALWIVTAIAFFLGGNIATEVEEVWEQRGQNQEQALNWMTERESGNQFAKYASSTIFAPAILIIPFPTMVNIEHQPNQMMFHGGYFVKNFMAFFVMFAFFHLLKNKKIRENLLLSSFLLGYLLIVAFSAFAQSERFHLPAMPLFMVFAAYGVHHLETKQKTVFNGYLIFIGLAIIAWSWFKLAGRGLA